MLPAYILAGGQSRRFGSDKSRHEIDGQPQLVRLAQRLTACGHTVHIVADRAERYADLGLTALVDEVPGSGPLAGLATALAHHESHLTLRSSYADGWILLVNCDQLRWDPAWTTQLFEAATNELQAVAWFDQLWHPMPGLYHISLLPHIQARLQRQQLSLQGLLDEANAVKIKTATPPSQLSFNKPSDLPPES